MSFIKVQSDWRLIKARWQQLGEQLELLDPVALSDEEFQLLACWREDPDNKKIYDQLPLRVAQWREAAIEEVTRKAVAQTGVIDENGKDPASILYRFQSDMRKIDAALFGAHAHSQMEVRGQLGSFDAIEYGSAHLHLDELHKPRLYLSRLIALPTCAVDRVRLKSLGPLQRIRAEWLIWRAGFDDADPKFRKKLRRMGVLKAMRLNSVSLLATHQYHRPKELATVHCASDIPTLNGVALPTGSGLYKAACG
jgi:hypothetical protein